MDSSEKFISSDGNPMTVIGSEASLKLLIGPRRNGWVWIYVKGYDASLPEEDIKKALANHFGSCGSICRIEFAEI